MLKNLLHIPDTFDPEDRRRRQVLNVLLIFSIVIAFLTILLTLAGLTCYECDPETARERNDPVMVWTILTLGLFSVLLWMNRSRRVPSWLSGAIFIICFTAVLSQADTPAELYNGRSTLVWALPIMLGTTIFPPRYGFLITLVIWGMFQFFSPPDIRYPTNPVNYFSMVVLLFITLISWLGMSIANRAIRDAHRHAANLQATLNSIADGVLVLDLQGHIISANPALLHMIPEEKLRELITKPLEKTFHLQRKFFSVTSSPVPGVGSVAVFRDETRSHETEHAKDSLLATISHGLRTPLMAVMNYLEMMQELSEEGKANTQKFLGYLQHAIESSSRLNHLVNNIIEQAQLQAGLLEFKRQACNLPSLLERIHIFFESALKGKDLSYELVIAPGVPAEIDGDPDRLYQMLMNLVSNGVKFTNQGGVKINVSLPSKETISIDVTDTGPGIPEEQLPDIFEPFRRGSDYAQREKQGVGLGLSIAREIVIRMGGEISAVSTLGAGSTFTVSLPVKQPQV